MLYSTLDEGRSSLRLSFDVAKEGLVARIAGSGFVGTMVPPLNRARASVGVIFVAIVGFLLGTTVLSHYVKGWRGYPTEASLAKRSLSEHSANTPPAAWPELFNHVMHFSVDAAIVCLGAVLAVAFIGYARSWSRLTGSRRVVPFVLLLAAGGLFVVREIAYHSDWVLGNHGLWWGIQALAHGRFALWPEVAFPLCMLASVVLFAVGGFMLFRRAELEAPLCRWIGGLAIGAAVFLGVALLSTVLWAVTLSVQSPGFLNRSSQGVLGAPLLPVFAVTIAAMAGTCWIVVAATARCLHTTREL